MGILTDLGLAGSGQRILLVAPPDSVLAEASLVKPRPAVASTLQVASPSPHIVWWPERRLLEPGQLSRLAWLLDASHGDAWLVIDEDDDVTAAEVHDALGPAGLAVADERAAGTATAIRVSPQRRL
ncbi:MAG: hypothetical protein Kow0010_15100 [Dehalococcoidia bacterium]